MVYPEWLCTPSGIQDSTLFAASIVKHDLLGSGKRYWNPRKVNLTLF